MSHYDSGDRHDHQVYTAKMDEIDAEREAKRARARRPLYPAGSIRSRLNTWVNDDSWVNEKDWRGGITANRERSDDVV